MRVKKGLSREERTEWGRAVWRGRPAQEALRWAELSRAEMGSMVQLVWWAGSQLAGTRRPRYRAGYLQEEVSEALRGVPWSGNSEMEGSAPIHISQIKTHRIQEKGKGLSQGQANEWQQKMWTGFPISKLLTLLGSPDGLPLL